MMRNSKKTTSISNYAEKVAAYQKDSIKKWTFLIKIFKDILIYIKLLKQSREDALQKSVLKSFARLTGKHLCWSLLFDKIAGLGL